MTFRAIRAGALASVLTIGFAAVAVAQTPVQPQPRDPNMPAPRNTVPEKVEPGSSTGSLSDRLQKSDGVIKPADPGTGVVVRPADPNGGMPVIPPNGTPGSARPNADPK